MSCGESRAFVYTCSLISVSLFSCGRINRIKTFRKPPWCVKQSSRFYAPFLQAADKILGSHTPFSKTPSPDPHVTCHMIHHPLHRRFPPASRRQNVSPLAHKKSQATPFTVIHRFRRASSVDRYLHCGRHSDRRTRPARAEATTVTATVTIGAAVGESGDRVFIPRSHDP